MLTSHNSLMSAAGRLIGRETVLAAAGSVASAAGDTRSVGGTPAAPIMLSTIDWSHFLAPSQEADEIGRTAKLAPLVRPETVSCK